MGNVQVGKLNKDDLLGSESGLARSENNDRWGHKTLDSQGSGLWVSVVGGRYGALELAGLGAPI